MFSETISCVLKPPHTHTYVSYMSRGKQPLPHAPIAMMVCLTKIPSQESRIPARNLWNNAEITLLPFRSSHQIMCHSDGSPMSTGFVSWVTANCQPMVACFHIELITLGQQGSQYEGSIFAEASWTDNVIKEYSLLSSKLFPESLFTTHNPID